MGALGKYKASVRICEDYFPEIVKRIFVVRAPRIFAQVWAIAKHFFDEGTRNKIQIVSEKDTYKVLTQYIDSEWIPASLGGTMQVGTSPDCEPLISMGGPVSQEVID